MGIPHISFKFSQSPSSWLFHVGVSSLVPRYCSCIVFKIIIKLFLVPTTKIVICFNNLWINLNSRLCKLGFILSENYISSVFNKKKCFYLFWKIPGVYLCAGKCAYINYKCFCGLVAWIMLVQDMNHPRYPVLQPVLFNTIKSIVSQDFPTLFVHL